MVRSDAGISLEVILNVFKYLIACFNKTLTLTIASVFFISVDFLCDGSIFPEGTVKCTHLALHSSKRLKHLFPIILLFIVNTSKKQNFKTISFTDPPRLSFLSKVAPCNFNFWWVFKNV